MHSTNEKSPRIRIMGDSGMEDIPYDSIPDPDPVAFDPLHYFDPPRIAPAAIDMASKIIPESYYLKHGGLHSLLQKRANEVFKTLPVTKRVGIYGKLKYFFDYDKNGPVLTTVAPL